MFKNLISTCHWKCKTDTSNMMVHLKGALIPVLRFLKSQRVQSQEGNKGKFPFVVQHEEYILITRSNLTHCLLSGDWSHFRPALEVQVQTRLALSINSYPCEFRPLLKIHTLKYQNWQKPVLKIAQVIGQSSLYLLVSFFFDFSTLFLNSCFSFCFFSNLCQK